MKTAPFRRAVAALSALLLVAPGARADAEPIRICQHVPITGAAPIPHHADRFGRFYFSYVNAELGGINNRPVEFRTFDDQSYPAGARAAVEKCEAEGPSDLILGPFGRDQIVSVAKWSETRQIPYLHGTAPQTSVAELGWSAAMAPPDEEQAKGMADILVVNAESLGGGREPVFGMVRVNSPYYDAAHDAFVARLAEHGHELAIDRAIQKDEGSFTDLYVEAANEGVTILVTLVTPLTLSRMRAQQPPGYDPLYATLTMDGSPERVTYFDRTIRMLSFVEPAPLYRPDDDSLPWHAEMQEFLRIFRQYSPEQNPEPDEVDWAMYIRAKQVHRWLLSLPSVDRASIRSSFSSYTESQEAAFPGCALDLATTPHAGAHRWNVLRNADERWDQVASCMGADTVTPDLSPPSLVCADGAPLALGEPECRSSDLASGIELIRVQTTSGGSGGTPTTAYFGCAPEAQLRVDAPPGVSRVKVTAVDCAGQQTAVELFAVSTT